MPAGWRIVNARYATTAFSGDGARRHGGRWNSPGVTIIYLAAHRSLAVLELLANARPRSPREKYFLIPATWDDGIMEVLAERQLPASWRAVPPDLSTVAAGDSWAGEMRSAVLAIPNAIIPSEANYLINPKHKNFRRIKIGKPESFVFDPRLLGRSAIA
ncbi:MAG: RES family NAD+ phosphorylase [Chthoniobacterales bacterium]